MGHHKIRLTAVECIFQDAQAKFLCNFSEFMGKATYYKAESWALRLGL